MTAPAPAAGQNPPAKRGHPCAITNKSNAPPAANDHAASDVLSRRAREPSRAAIAIQ